jgi:hypothetical protein
MSDKQFATNEENYLDDDESNVDFSKESLSEKIVARSRMIIVGLGVTVVLTIGTVMYTSAQEADSIQYSNSGNSSYGYQYTGQYGGQSSQYGAQYAVQNNGSNAGAAAGGGGCGGGSTAGGGGGGCCGGGTAGAAGSSSTASASPAELEKQALEKYKAETGKTDVTVKVESRGCHTQIDIYDKAGNIVRSYGYQGGPLYVIS